MIAYKGFGHGLICRDYQFAMGINRTEKANCRENGFHCAENPLDCLTYCCCPFMLPYNYSGFLSQN